MQNIFKNLLGKDEKQTKVRDFEWERFQRVAKEQFIKLKEKGLSIPVMTF